MAARTAAAAAIIIVIAAFFLDVLKILVEVCPSIRYTVR